METINKEHFQALITEKNLIKLHENMNMLQQKIQGNILDTLIQEFDLPTLQKGRIAQARKDYELAEHYYTIAIKKGNTEGRQIGFLNL